MVIPFIVANSEAALRAVAPEYRHASIALGVSRQSMVLRIFGSYGKERYAGRIGAGFRSSCRRNHGSTYGSRQYITDAMFLVQ